MPTLPRQSSYRATRPDGKTIKIKSDLQTFSVRNPEGRGGLFSALPVPSRGDGKVAVCGMSWALLEWGTPSFAMRFLSLSHHVCVHETSVKLLGRVTGPSLAPTPSHSPSLSLFHPPMASHRTLLPWVRACYPPNHDPSRVFSECISALGCILSHKLSKVPRLGQTDGLQETCRLFVGHSCHWDEDF